MFIIVIYFSYNIAPTTVQHLHIFLYIKTSVINSIVIVWFYEKHLFHQEAIISLKPFEAIDQNYT